MQIFLCKEHGVHERTLLVLWKGKPPIEIQSPLGNLLNVGSFKPL